MNVKIISDRYISSQRPFCNSGGLDTVHDLTGTSSIYTQWRNIEVMFHVSTMLPFEQSDPQKVRGGELHHILCIALEIHGNFNINNLVYTIDE